MFTKGEGYCNFSCVCNQYEGLQRYTLTRGYIHPSGDYIRLAAITYQSFGLNKKEPRYREALFLARWKGLEPLTYWFVGAMDSMQLFQTTTYSGVYSSYKYYSTTIFPIIPNVPSLCVGRFVVKNPSVFRHFFERLFMPFSNEPLHLFLFGF